MKSILIISFQLFCLAGITQSPIQSFQPGVGWGGRTVAITVHPVFPEEVITGTATGGLFKSTDGGNTWRHIETLPVFAIQDVKYNPNFHNLVIATCGIDTDTSRKVGIWLSSDRGETWRQIDALVPVPSAAHRARFPKRFNGWGISFDMNGVAYVGTDYGVAVGKASHSRWEHVMHDTGIPIARDKFQNAVYSVHAFGSGKLIIGTPAGVYYCNDMYLRNPFRKSPSGMGFIRGTTHGIAQSPYHEKDILITPDQNNLQYSADTGINFVAHPMPFPGGRISRANLVVMSRSPEANMVDVYVHKVKLTRKRYHKDRMNPRDRDWQDMEIPHDDICGFAVVGDHLSYVVGDGGVFKRRDGRWVTVGNGRNGYNALQVYNVWGQQIVRRGTTTPIRTDYYFGTQDNNIYSSSDGGRTWPYDGGVEGGGFQGPRVTNEGSHPSVGYGNFSSGENKFTRPNFAGLGNWRDPGTPRGNPKYAGNNTWLQTFTDTLTGDVRLMKTFNNGRDWDRVGIIRGGFRLWQGERASMDSNYVMYVPYSRPLSFTNDLANVGLLRLEKRVGRGGVEEFTLTNMDTVRSLGSLMVYPADFAWPTVYAFDPSNHNRLLAPDVEDKVMKWSLNGGRTWTADHILTRLITENGRYDFFSIPVLISVWTISFNPSNPRQIAIGTRDAGIVYTSDGGSNWCRIPGSKQIPFITSIWWDFDGTALVSSYGRGLWRFNPSLFRRTDAGTSCVSTHVSIVHIPDRGRLILNPAPEVSTDLPPSLARPKIQLAEMKPVLTLTPYMGKNRPMASLITSTTRDGEMVIGEDGKALITGFGFSSKDNASIEWEGKTLVKSIPVSSDGTIKYSMKFKPNPGIYTLIIVQEINKKRMETPLIVKVPFYDMPGK